jgi:hypothetical protein
VAFIHARASDFFSTHQKEKGVTTLFRVLYKTLKYKTLKYKRDYGGEEQQKNSNHERALISVY